MHSLGSSVIGFAADMDTAMSLSGGSDTRVQVWMGGGGKAVRVVNIPVLQWSWVRGISTGSKGLGRKEERNGKGTVIPTNRFLA